MIMGIAALLFIPLLAAAIACALWSVGRSWPLRDKAIVAQAITGRPDRTGPPSRWLLALLALFFIGAGIVALSLADPAAGGIGLDIAGALLGLLFIARGAAGYSAGWRATFPAEPFATIDRKTYSPAALILGAGFLLLVVLRLV
jgi:hypothetical protein